MLAAVVVFAGFAPTYFLQRVFGTPELSPLLHVHGFLFSSWIAWSVVQTTLVAARRTDIHRRLGVAGAALATAMMVLAVLVLDPRSPPIVGSAGDDKRPCSSW